MTKPTWSDVRRELLAMAEEDHRVRTELAADGSLFDRPAFQREALEALRLAAARGEVPAMQPALLEDRIRTLEGRPQRYGTQCDWDESGELSPFPVEDPESVDDRRRAVGLGPLDEAIRAQRRAAAAEGERPPGDWHARRRGMEAWLREVGWRQ